MRTFSLLFVADILFEGHVWGRSVLLVIFVVVFEVSTPSLLALQVKMSNAEQEKRPDEVVGDDDEPDEWYAVPSLEVVTTD